MRAEDTRLAARISETDDGTAVCQWPLPVDIVNNRVKPVLTLTRRPDTQTSTRN